MRSQLEHELKLIADLDYVPYFLTVHSIAAEAIEPVVDLTAMGDGAEVVGTTGRPVCRFAPIPSPSSAMS